MKRLIEFFFGRKLKNKPFGMAWIRGLGGNGCEVLNGRAVRTVRCFDGRWEIEPHQFYVCQKPTTFLPQGIRVRAGDLAEIVAIADECLDLWKDDGVTEKEVERLFAPELPAPQLTKEASPHEHRTKTPNPAGNLDRTQAGQGLHPQDARQR